MILYYFIGKIMLLNCVLEKFITDFGGLWKLKKSSNPQFYYAMNYRIQCDIYSVESIHHIFYGTYWERRVLTNRATHSSNTLQLLKSVRNTVWWLYLQ